MLEITIAPQENSSIKKEISLNLKGYTVFAGENNSGKTNLIKGIISEIGKDKIIYIPAENINAPEVVKTGAANDPMRDIVSKLLNIVIGDIPKIGGGFDVLFKKIETSFESFEIPNTNLKLSPKPYTKSDFKKILEDEIAKKILDYKILDNHYDSEIPLTFDSVGQGIQRIIIATIIQEIGKTRINEDELIILFEEPEIYLHPKLKKKLFESLVKIAENPNVNIIVTTHDPYFIQLSRDKDIYHILRDSDGATQINPVESKTLPEVWRSFAEINYKVFGVNGEDYLNELYGYLESKLNNNWKNVENELKNKEDQNKNRQYLGNTTSITTTSYIRHEIHHRAGESEYNKNDIEAGIQNLQTIISEKDF